MPSAENVRKWCSRRGGKFIHIKHQNDILKLRSASKDTYRQFTLEKISEYQYIADGGNVKFEFIFESGVMKIKCDRVNFGIPVEKITTGSYGGAAFKLELSQHWRDKKLGPCFLKF